MTQRNGQTTIGIFETVKTAKLAVKELEAKGYSSSQIDLSSNRVDETHRDNDLDNHDEPISRFFNNLFDSKDEAKEHTRTSRNKAIVAVHTERIEQARAAAEIMDEVGANDIEKRRGKNLDVDTDVDVDTNLKKEGEISAEVIDEDVKIGKKVVQKAGGVKLKSRIIERPVEETVRLREEHVYIDRDKVNRPATEADFDKFKEGTVVVTEEAEEVMVDKDARVVEEVTVKKDVDYDETTVSETERHTEVEVEKIDKEVVDKEVHQKERKDNF